MEREREREREREKETKKGWKDCLSRAVMNVTARHAPVRLKFVIFGTHHWSQGKPRKVNGEDK